MRDWQTVQRHAGTVRRASPEFTSNLYAAREQIERWCSAGTLRVLPSEDVVLLLRADRDFDHLYHVAASQAALEQALAALPRATYSSDLIGRGEELNAVRATYEAGGFRPHKILIRMTRGQVNAQSGGEGVNVATPADASAVAALLDRLLDPLLEQVPDLTELEREAKAGQLLIVRTPHAIAGMLLYDLKGRTAHLRLWHVDGKARGEGVGRRLMASFLSRCSQAQRLILWVIGDNERSVAIYRHYGFTPDGLLDQVMIRQELSGE